MEEIKKGQVLYAQGKIDEAMKTYTRLIKENINSPTIFCNRAKCYMKLELYKTAIKDCDASLSLDKNYQIAYVIKGHALVQLKKRQEAIKVWKEGCEISGDVDIFSELFKLANEMETPESPNATQTQIQTQNHNQNQTQNNHNQNHNQNNENQTKQAESVTITTKTTINNAQDIPTQSTALKSKGQTYERGQDGKWEQVSGPPPKTVIAKEGNVHIPNKATDPSRAASALVAARGMVQHGVGKAEIDEKIALGYLQVNTGNHQTAIELFSELLKSNPRVVAAYLGRGTAYALSGVLDKAIADFSAGIEVDKNCVDAWKRRGQARAAKGQDHEALGDLTQAIVLSKDPLGDQESFHQRGLVYYKLHNYKRALPDFRKAASIDKQSKLSWNHIGLCLNAIGSAHEAIEAHARAIGIDPLFKEAWANMAQAYRDLGDHVKASQLFDKSLEIDPRYAHSFHLRGLLRFGVGDHKRAYEDLNLAVQLTPSSKDFRHMRGVMAQGLGLLSIASADYSIIFSSKPDHVAWYQNEVTLYVHHHLDQPLTSFNIDKDMDPYFKEGWCKRNHPATLARYKAQPRLSPKISDVKPASLTPDEQTLIKEATVLGGLLQYKAAGYLENKRQQRAAGLAIIEIAQRLRNGIWNIKKGSGQSSSLHQANHKFDWRDLYDIGVKWRQYSEPNDPVWWVDLLSPEQFAEGFGSHTPMVTGQTKVIRYYPMFERSFAIMKRLIPEQCNISEDGKRNIEEAKECGDVYEVMRKDFYVVTPCHSTARPGSIMEGTRLTIQLANPEGYEYSIRTPGTPPRWAEYHQEMQFVWSALLRAVTAPEPVMDEVVDLILTLTFYWYNFMPLSRGTAAVGYMTLIALFLALGFQITTEIPENLQPDWEAILRPTPQEFIGVMKGWLFNATSKKERQIDDLPLISSSFPTIRKVLQALNADM